MSQALHIASKDVRRLRGLLVLWAVVIAARVAFRISGATLAPAGIEATLLVGQLAGLIGALEVLLTAFLAARLVHEEPLVGLDAFWLTRPYDPASLMHAKLVFAFAALVLVPLAADLVVMTWFGAGWSAQAVASLPLLAGYLFWMLFFLTVAALTASTASFVIALVGVGLTMSAALMILIAATAIVGPTEEPFRRTLVGDPLPGLVGGVVILAGAAMAIAYQYRHRRRMWTVALAAGALVLAIVISTAWPPSFAATDEPDPGSWADDAMAAPAVLDAGRSAQVRQAYVASGAEEQWQVFAPVRLDGMPREFGITAAGARSSWQLSSRERIDSMQMASISPWLEERGTEPPRHPPLEAVLGDVRFLESTPGPRSEIWPALLRLPEADYRRYAGQTGRLDADVDLHLVRSQPVVALPLERGAAGGDGYSRFLIAALENTADGVVVYLRYWRTAPPLWRNIHAGYDFVLRNRARGEALTGGNEPWGPSGGSISTTNVALLPLLIASNAGRGFDVSGAAVRFPGRSRIGDATRPRLDAAWLGGAEVVVVEHSHAGRVTRHVRSDAFTLPPRP